MEHISALNVTFSVCFYCVIESLSYFLVYQETNKQREIETASILKYHYLSGTNKLLPGLLLLYYSYHRRRSK